MDFDDSDDDGLGDVIKEGDMGSMAASSETKSGRKGTHGGFSDDDSDEFDLPGMGPAVPRRQQVQQQQPANSVDSDDDYDTDDRLERQQRRARQSTKRAQSSQQKQRAPAFRTEPEPDPKPVPKAVNHKSKLMFGDDDSFGASGEEGGQPSPVAAGMQPQLVKRVDPSSSSLQAPQVEPRIRGGSDFDSDFDSASASSGSSGPVMGGILRGIRGNIRNQPKPVQKERPVSPLSDDEASNKTLLPPLDLKAPPLPDSVIWDRQPEFDALDPSVIYCAPFSEMSFKDIFAPGLHLEQLFVFKIASGSLGKMILQPTEVPTIINIRWVTYNVLLPNSLDLFSDGTAAIDVTDTAKCCFNLTYGNYAQPQQEKAWGTTLATWGTLPPEVAFVPSVESNKITLQPMAGTQFHDIDPFCETGDLAEIGATLQQKVIGAQQTFEEFRWQPPHVLTMSDEGIGDISDKIGDISDKTGGSLDATSLKELLGQLFGREVFRLMANMQREVADGDEDIFALLCATPLRFMESPYVPQAIWKMVSEDGAFLVDRTIVLIDQVVVQQDMNIVAEFLVSVVFHSGDTIARKDLKSFLQSVIGAETTNILNNPVIDTIFKGGRSVTKQELRYSINFLDDTGDVIQFFNQIACHLSKAWDWEREI